MLGFYDFYQPALRLGETMAAWAVVVALFAALAVA